MSTAIRKTIGHTNEEASGEKNVYFIETTGINNGAEFIERIMLNMCPKVATIATTDHVTLLKWNITRDYLRYYIMQYLKYIATITTTTTSAADVYIHEQDQKKRTELLRDNITFHSNT